MSRLMTPRNRSGSFTSLRRGSNGAPQLAFTGTCMEALREMRETLETSNGSVADIRARMLQLVDELEQDFVASAERDHTSEGSASTQSLVAPMDPAELLAQHQEKLEKFLLLVPEKRITKSASPFMVNELMPADAVLSMPVKGFTKTARNLKKGTKAYDKKLEEMKRLLSHMFKVYDQDLKLHEDVGTLYHRIMCDGNSEALFFECEGQRQIESMVFMSRISSGSLVMTLALYFNIMKLPLFGTDNILYTKGKNSFASRLLDVTCKRNDLQVQRATLFMLAKVVEMLGYKDMIMWSILQQWHHDNPNHLHPIGTVVDIMVTHRDGIVISSGLKLINMLIKTCEDGPEQEELNEVLQSTLYHRAMVQFTKSPTAQAVEEVTLELKKYQAWFLRDIKRTAMNKFSLDVPEHCEMLTEYWTLRHADGGLACPVTSSSSGYSDETALLWADAGFFSDPITVMTSVLRMEDLLHFAKTRTKVWNTMLDKLSANRKMAEKAKGATIGKIDFDMAALSAGLTSRIVELMTSPAPLIPAQQILWSASGRMAVHSAGMDMARTIFAGYKLFDRNNTKQLLDDAVVHLLGALQGNPPDEGHLHRLMAFFASRSSEQDRLRTLRGGGSGLGSKNSLAAGPIGGSGQFKAQYPSLYRESLEDMEPGPGGVPQIIHLLTEGILSCGGEQSVGLFRLPPSTEALSLLEERLDSGVRGSDVFRNVSDPNIPGIVLKRLLTALSPPIIDKYSAVVEAVRLNQFQLFVDILRKLDPLNKATLNHLLDFLKFMAEPIISEVTKMDAANIAMVFSPTLLRDESRGDRPSLGASFLEKDAILYLLLVAERIK